MRIDLTSKLKQLVAKARMLLPSRRAVDETVGLAVLGVSAFALLSLVSYDPVDLRYPGERLAVYKNLGGPLGANLSHAVFSAIGVLGLAWAALLAGWGLFLLVGFAGWPPPKRVLTLALLTALLAALAHLRFPHVELLQVPEGVGGSVGEGLAEALRGSVGYGGAMLVLGLFAVAILVWTGIVTAARAGHSLEYGIYVLRRLRHRARARATAKRERAAAPVVEAEDEGSKRRVRKKKPAPQEDDAELGDAPDFSSAVPRHPKPEPELFRVAEDVARSADNLEESAELLESQLREFKVEGKICSVTEGPVVTTLEFEPAPGTKVSKIVGLGEDLARLLTAESLRVIAPIPGKNTVGFEVPNARRKVIRFGNVLRGFNTGARGMAMPIAMGVDTFGKTCVEDLAEMPHLLIAGATGAGKSVFVNTLIASLVYRNTARELRFVMIDPKMIELAGYEKLPHMAWPVVTDPKKDGLRILNALVSEMEERYRRMGALNARNVRAFNETIRTSRRSQYVSYDGKWEPMPYVVLLIDEFADMIHVLGKEVEFAITRLAQKARAAGIHLVITTQRPSVNVVTGLIKANFPTRVAFRVLGGVDSRTILDQGGAETLLGKGDMLFMSATGIQRLHAPFLEDSEVRKLVKACASPPPD